MRILNHFRLEYLNQNLIHFQNLHIRCLDWNFLFTVAISTNFHKWNKRKNKSAFDTKFSELFIHTLYLKLYSRMNNFWQSTEASFVQYDHQTMRRIISCNKHLMINFLLLILSVCVGLAFLMGARHQTQFYINIILLK